MRNQPTQRTRAHSASHGGKWHAQGEVSVSVGVGGGGGGGALRHTRWTVASARKGRWGCTCGWVGGLGGGREVHSAIHGGTWHVQGQVRGGEGGGRRGGTRCGRGWAAAGCFVFVCAGGLMCAVVYGGRWGVEMLILVTHWTTLGHSPDYTRSLTGLH